MERTRAGAVLEELRPIGRILYWRTPWRTVSHW